MSEFRIEKVRRRVTIALVGGTTVQGDVFLQPNARYRIGPQDPADLFNEAEPFLPIVGDGDEFRIVAKEQVIRVQFEDGGGDTDIVGIADAHVEVIFTDGSAAAGEMRLETRGSRSRLTDFLNDDQRRFLTLRLPQGICLVNRSQIVQVRQR